MYAFTPCTFLQTHILNITLSHIWNMCHLVTQDFYIELRGTYFQKVSEFDVNFLTKLVKKKKKKNQDLCNSGERIHTVWADWYHSSLMAHKGLTGEDRRETHSDKKLYTNRVEMPNCKWRRGEGVDTANDNADMPAACHPWLSHRCNLFDTEQSLVWQLMCFKKKKLPRNFWITGWFCETGIR